MKEISLKRFLGAGALVVVLVLSVFTFGACSKSSEEGDGDSETKVKVVIAGSTSVQPLSEAIAEEYMADGNGDVEVMGGGSGQGIKACEDGSADLGAISRELKEEEKAGIKYEYVLAYDGIAIVVNKDVGVKDITLGQLKDIFTGVITNWKEVGGKDMAIKVVAREDGSGTRGAFGELTGVVSKDESGNEIDSTVDTAIIQGSTGAVMTTVAGEGGAIGYVSLGSLNDSVDALTVEGVKCSEKTIVDKSYKLSRPFIYISKDKPKANVQAWLDFVLGETGQKIVKDMGFIGA